MDDGVDATRAKLVRAAVRIFSTCSFDAISAREVERRAGVNRGLLAYHFDSKEGLWRAAVDWLMERYHDEMAQYQPLILDLTPAERARVLLKVAIRFHAKNPEYFRLLVLHGNDKSEQLQWLVEENVRRNLQFFHKITGGGIDFADESEAVLHYLFTGAALIFAVQGECQLLFGFDPTDEAFVERYAAFVADLYHPESLPSSRVREALTGLGETGVGQEGSFASEEDL